MRMGPSVVPCASSVADTVLSVIALPPSLPAQVPAPVEVIVCVFRQQLGTNTGWMRGPAEGAWRSTHAGT